MQSRTGAEFKKVEAAMERTCPLEVLCLVLEMVRRLTMEERRLLKGEAGL